MTIYFITNGINRTAGTERVIVQLAKAFKEVIIIVPGTTANAFSGYEDLNIVSAKVGEFPTSGNLAKFLHRIQYLKALKELIKLESASVVLTFSFDLNILNIWLSKKFHYRVIVCEHIEYNYHSGLRNIIRKQMYKQERVTLVCLTETDKTKFQLDGIKTEAIPNFIHPAQSHYSSQSKKILAVGRLEFQKNFSFLIDAFAMSKLYEKGWTLDIVGEGAEQVILESKIQSLQLNQYIYINKFTKDIVKYYENAALMCMTSRFEAFPMVLLEALNHALPVLVTDFPTGAREILGDNNLQIVKHYNVTLFAQVLLEFCEDEALRNKLSENNLQLVRKYYPNAIIDSWNQLLISCDRSNLR